MEHHDSDPHLNGSLLIICRKENQIYSAEEKAALAMYNFEENKRKEQKILGDMQKLVQSTLGVDEGEYEAPAGPDMPPEAA